MAQAWEPAALSLSPAERLKRARSVRLHVIVALVTLLACIAANALFTAKYPWWLWVLTAWMPLIAAHTAWSMGLFDRNREGR